MRTVDEKTYGEIEDTVAMLLGYHRLLLDGALGPVSKRQSEVLVELVKGSERLAVLLAMRRPPGDASRVPLPGKTINLALP